MLDAVKARRAERERLLAVARSYVDRLSATLDVRAAGVAGSVARGDFNVWSDVDVVVVAEGLPSRAPNRAALLLTGAPPGVQPVGYTPAELPSQLSRRNPLLVELIDHGVIFTGKDLLADAKGRFGSPRQPPASGG